MLTLNVRDFIANHSKVMTRFTFYNSMSNPQVQVHKVKRSGTKRKFLLQEIHMRTMKALLPSIQSYGQD